MEDFVQLARELRAHSSTTPLDDDFSTCPNGYNSFALLDDRAPGIIFPTGENLPAATPNRIENSFGIESNEAGFAMNGSITLAPYPNDFNMPLEVLLAINVDDQGASLLSPSPKTDQFHSASPSTTMKSSGQLKPDVFLPFSPMAPSLVQPRKSTSSHRRPNESSLSEMHDDNDSFNRYADFGNTQYSDIADINPTLVHSGQAYSADITAQLKQEEPSMSGLGMSTVGLVSVSAAPPPAEKKETSSCKVVDCKIYVKLNKNFWLKFCGSYEALMDTEIRLETSYLEPDNRDTPVLACPTHWDQHFANCKAEHQEQKSFLCTGGLVPVQNKCDAFKHYTPLSGISGNRLVDIGSGEYAFNLKTTALCWNSCHPHKDNGKIVALTVSLQSKTTRIVRNHEFKVTCCESPTRDSKPPAYKRRRQSSSSSTINIPMTPSCLMSPRSQPSSPLSSSEDSSTLAKNFFVMTPPLSEDDARRVYHLIFTKFGVSCRFMEDKANI